MARATRPSDDLTTDLTQRNRERKAENTDATQADKRGRKTRAVNLTPMLDVVFIMLIFFIVTASFVKEAGIDVSRPGSGLDG